MAPPLVLFHASDLHFGYEDRAALDWFAAEVEREWQSINGLDFDYSSADILFRNPTEDDAFTWHPSLGEEGFGPISIFDLMVFPKTIAVSEGFNTRFG